MNPLEIPTLNKDIMEQGFRHHAVHEDLRLGRRFGEHFSVVSDDNARGIGQTFQHGKVARGGLRKNKYSYGFHGELNQLGYAEGVAEFCSCGAQLAEDALFCHRCGKPQRELPEVHAPDVQEPQEETIAPAAAAPVAETAPAFSSEINFSNRGAVRICLFCAVGASVLSSLPLGMLSVFWLLLTLLGSGFVAVYVYHRRSGQYLAARAGARMGWMTGLFYWLIAMIVFAMKMVALSGKGGLGALLREQMEASAGRDDASVQEALRILESPQGLATMIIFVLFFAFLFFTALPAIGGMLGSKVIEKEN